MIPVDYELGRQYQNERVQEATNHRLARDAMPGKAVRENLADNSFIEKRSPGMEPLGSHYAILLHDPQLRQVLVEEPSRPRPATKSLLTLRSLRSWFAHTLVGLAARIEPNTPVWSTASRGEAVPGR